MTRIILFLNTPAGEHAADFWCSLGLGLVAVALLIIKVAM